MDILTNVTVHTDRPIQSAEQDILGRQALADRLVDIINGYVNDCENQHCQDGLVIGLEGKWGSGKTSLFQLAEKALRRPYAENDLRRPYNVATFNSWLASDRDSLIEEFFKIFQEECTRGVTGKKIDVLAYGFNFMRKHADAIGAIGALANIPLAPQIRDVLKCISDKSISQQKSELVERLRKSEGYWIVFFIDDIDRLSDDEISTIFTLVKNIADFPKIIYVLAYDKEVVSNALNKVHAGKGNSYLQKVVQIPFPMPVPSQYEVNCFFLNRLAEIYKSKPEDFIDTKHLEKIYYEGCIGYIQNIRDCKRVLNAFYVRYISGAKECDVGDLLGLTILELYEPMVFEAIKQRKELLTLDREIPPESLVRQEVKSIRSWLVNMLSERAQSDTLIIDLLFPVLGEIANDKAQFSPSTIRAQNFKQICIRKFFNLYFSLQVDFKSLREDEIEWVFDCKDEDELLQRFVRWQKDKRLVEAFSSLNCYLDEENEKKNPIDLHVQTVKRLYRVLSRYKLEWDFNDSLGDIYFERSRFIYRLFWNLYIRRRSISLCELDSIFTDTKISAVVLGSLLRHVGVGQNLRYGSQRYHSDPAIIDQTAIAALKKKYMNTLHREEEEKTLLTEDGLADVFLLWQCIDENDYGRFLKTLTSPQDIYRTVLAYMSAQPPSAFNDGGSWSISSMWPKSLDRSFCMNRLEEFTSCDDFQQLPPMEKEIVHAFIFLVRNNRKQVKREEIKGNEIGNGE